MCPKDTYKIESISYCVDCPGVIIQSLLNRIVKFVKIIISVQLVIQDLS